MKAQIHKQIGFAALAMIAILIATAATFPAPKALASDKGETKKEAAEAAPAEAKQCGVTNAQIADYLRGAPHYHTVYAVWNQPGTCNSYASMENCTIATVYVSDGIIIGHTDSQGVCE